jgi:hypothetical protein
LWCCVSFFGSGGILNPLKNIASQTTVPFFPVLIFSGRKVIDVCVKIQTPITRPKKITTEKKGTVIWPAMFFELPEKITKI